MRTEEEIREKIAEIEKTLDETRRSIKTCDSTGMRVTKFYRYAISQLKWVISDD